MTDAERKSLIALPAVLVLGLGLALAGSQNGAAIAGIPLFTIAVAAAFLIQWVVFVPSFLGRTERYFDLTGSLTYIAVTVGLLLAAPLPDLRAGLVAVLVLAWAGRLGSFLSRRVTKAGHDDRFDEIKPSLPRFLTVWTIQGLWVSITASAAWIVITAQRRVPLDWFAAAGAVMWLIGFGIEVIADKQKSAFRADPDNRDRFIDTGLWSTSRHPNYFGEILLWLGVAVIALPVLQGWQWIALISPVFVVVLLTRVSGIPLLEAKAERKWGGQPDYEAYKRRTPVLIPRP